MDQAFFLFQEQGYRHVTMEQIAHACGIARPSLYEYFKNKEELLMVLAEQAVNETVDQPPSGEDCKTRLRELAETYLARILKHRPLYKILFAETAALSPNVAVRLLDWRRKHAAHVAAVLEEGRLAGVLRTGLAIPDGVFLFLAVIGQRGGELLMSEERPDPAAEADRLCELVWHGLVGL